MEATRVTKGRSGGTAGRRRKRPEAFLSVPYHQLYGPFELCLWVVLKLAGLEPNIAKLQRTEERQADQVYGSIDNAVIGICEFSFKDRENIPDEHGYMRCRRRRDIHDGIARPFGIIALVDDKYELDRRLSNLKGTQVISHAWSRSLLVQDLCLWLGENAWSLNDLNIDTVQRICDETVSDYQAHSNYDQLPAFYERLGQTLPQVTEKRLAEQRRLIAEGTERLLRFVGSEKKSP